jgi:hypothetical protein
VVSVAAEVAAEVAAVPGAVALAGEQGTVPVASVAVEVQAVPVAVASVAVALVAAPGAVRVASVAVGLQAEAPDLDRVRAGLAEASGVERVSAVQVLRVQALRAQVVAGWAATLVLADRAAVPEQADLGKADSAGLAAPARKVRAAIDSRRLAAANSTTFLVCRPTKDCTTSVRQAWGAEMWAWVATRGSAVDARAQALVVSAA